MGGTGALTIHLDKEAGLQPMAEPEAARLRITDTGCGMDAVTLDRAFEPFFTTKPIGQGTGLGLPLVYALVQEIGGIIKLGSAPGAGTTVTILMPVSKAVIKGGYQRRLSKAVRDRHILRAMRWGRPCRSRDRYTPACHRPPPRRGRFRRSPSPPCARHR